MQIENKNSKTIPKPTHFGKNLKFLRRLQGLSQTELANQIGMKRNNIASYESGMVEPNAKKYLHFCDFFAIDPKDMLESQLSESPSDNILLPSENNNIIDVYLEDQMELFIIKTNEMTKVFEGYKAFFEMKKESDSYEENRALYATLEDLLSLLNALVVSNWELIQSVYPNMTNDQFKE